jgi:hypothetical protein
VQSTHAPHDTLGSSRASHLKRGVHDVVEINRHTCAAGHEILIGQFEQMGD